MLELAINGGMMKVFFAVFASLVSLSNFELIGSVNF